ncbi:MAG: signal recognition particle protein [Caldiserica bacterium]|jgi:signal recognition particle subunit SRP54|nr:signal recognition particle protein [Caldisericota bacterium]MDH7562902.1 signal recognition particle protein [Caldisericota bacterium]
MFDFLTSKLQEVFRKLTSRGKLTPEEVEQYLKEIRVALLSSDVHVQVVKAFSDRVKEKAVGQAVMESLTPGQQVIKIVRDELLQILGEKPSPFPPASLPTTVMLIGLQGSGKTTTCVKLAKNLRNQGKHVLLIGLDAKRPAAMEQLSYLGQKEGIPVFLGTGKDPLDLARSSLQFFQSKGFDIGIIDTAGRLHVDSDLMEELHAVKKIFNPSETILVLDSTLGHVSLSVGNEFQRSVGFDSLILTKLDGDAKGGAALSIHFLTGKPIRFIGTGEKVEDLEVFHPDRFVSRIMGMGDMLTLIEKAEKALSLSDQEKLERQIKGGVTLSDFLEQLEGVSRMGNIKDLIPSIPGVSPQEVDKKMLLRFKAIIQSMTYEERENPGIINSSRKKRISHGSGTSVSEVNMLLKRFEQFRLLLKQAKKGNLPFLNKFSIGG